MVLANDSQSLLAERCLVEIDELRDEYGRIDASRDIPVFLPSIRGPSSDSIGPA